ncbi:deaminase [Haladaptatus pallidirubidus]|uniref:deaminase n=1 Tax=Haladaptatus pallidirubidus TaxID=1008152 RepID=UPI001D0F6E49
MNAVGALIVGEEGILVKSSGAIFDRLEVTVHSEIEAIRKAFAALESSQLNGYWLYSTHEPCQMCIISHFWAPS